MQIADWTKISVGHRRPIISRNSVSKSLFDEFLSELAAACPSVSRGTLVRSNNATKTLATHVYLPLVKIGIFDLSNYINCIKFTVKWATWDPTRG